MKNIVLLSLMLSGVCFHVNAQSKADSNARSRSYRGQNRYNKTMKNYPVRFGIKAGFNSSTLTMNEAGGVSNKKAIAGWHAGAYADIPLLPIVSLQPGLLLTKKGAKFTAGDNASANYTEVSTRPLYLEIPVNLVVKIPLPNKVKLFAGAGPYIAFGVGGKNKMEGKLLGAGFSDNTGINYGKDDSGPGSYHANLKRLDAGVNLIAGLEISHFTLATGYGIGVSNTRSGSNSGEGKYKNRVFSLSVGVLF